jgi:hypothetical protein
MEWNEVALAGARAWLSSHSNPLQCEFFEHVIKYTDKPVILLAPRGSGKTTVLVLIATVAIQSGATVEWYSDSQLRDFAENMQQVVGYPLSTIITLYPGGWYCKISSREDGHKILVFDGLYKRGIGHEELMKYSRVCGASSGEEFLRTMGPNLDWDIISPPPTN